MAVALGGGMACMQSLGRAQAKTNARTPRALASAQLSYSPHPDAIRRRQEAEAAVRQRERERAEEAAKEARGQKWWEGSLPPNMIAVVSPGQLDAVQRQASVQGRALLINFFTEDCYTCKTLHRKLKAIANDHPDILFVKVNGSCEELRLVFEDAGVTKVPFFHTVMDGRVVSRFSASLNPEKLAVLRRELMMMSGVRQSAMVMA